MKLEWMILGLVAFGLIGLGLFTLLKVSSECDRKARRTENKLRMSSDETVTQLPRRDH